MKRILLFLSLITFHFSFCSAQNLVPNQSFEDIIHCVNADDEFNDSVADWRGQSAGGGLCYFTSQCGQIVQVDVPSNEFGFQYAHTGVSYAGIYTYISDTASHASDSNWRNYIEAKLTSPLANGTKYYVTFYVSLPNFMNFACNDIGAYISDSLIVLDTMHYSYVKEYLIPQIANNPITHPLTDTLNWIKVTGTYIANGGEKYIIIGNFKNDTLSHIQYLGHRSHGGTGAYYYIDDVFVTTDSLLAGEDEVKVESEKVEVYPNPSNGVFSIEVNNEKLKVNSEVEVYNMMGEKIYTAQLNSSNTQMDLSNNTDGIYLYRVLT